MNHDEKNITVLMMKEMNNYVKYYLLLIPKNSVNPMSCIIQLVQMKMMMKILKFMHPHFIQMKIMKMENSCLSKQMKNGI